MNYHLTVLSALVTFVAVMAAGLFSVVDAQGPIPGGSGGPMPTIAPQYGNLDAFNNLAFDPEFDIQAVAPLPAGCPAWMGVEYAVADYLLTFSQTLSVSATRALWVKFNLSPRISSAFSVSAFFDVVTNKVKVDDNTNMTVGAEFEMMQMIVTSKNLSTSYPKCVTGAPIETIPPMPSTFTAPPGFTDPTTASDPPMPTMPPMDSNSGEDTGMPALPSYEPNSLVMTVTPDFNEQTFLNKLATVLNKPTAATTIHLEKDIWDEDKYMLINCTAEEKAAIQKLTAAQLKALGVSSVSTGNDFPDSPTNPRSDLAILLNLTAEYQRVSPLPAGCPAFLSNDTLLQAAAKSQFPISSAMYTFADKFGSRFVDGFNLTCLVRYWTDMQGTKEYCPNDFAGAGVPGATFAPGANTLAPGSNSGLPPLPTGSGSSAIPSADSMSGDIPSSDSMSGMPSSMSGSSGMPPMPTGSGSSGMPPMPTGGMSGSSNMPMPSQSDFIPPSTSGSGSGDMPIPTSPSDRLDCKVPFEGYAGCVLAQDTLGAVLLLDQLKQASATAMCFCKDCTTPAPPESSLEPDITLPENGTLPPETWPPLPSNMSDSGSLSFPPSSMSGSMNSNMPGSSGSMGSNPVVPSGPPSNPVVPPPPTPTQPSSQQPTQPPATTAPSNSVAITTDASYNATTFKAQLAAKLGISPNDITLTTDPNDPKKVIVTFSGPDAQKDKNQTMSLSQTDLNQIGASAVDDSPTPGGAAPEEKKSNAGMIAGIVVGLIVVIAIGAFLYIQNSSASRSAGDESGSQHMTFTEYAQHADAQNMNTIPLEAQSTGNINTV